MGLKNMLTASRQRGKTSGKDTKQSDDEVSVMMELWRMQSTPSLLSVPVPLLLGVVALDSHAIQGIFFSGLDNVFV